MEQKITDYLDEIYGGTFTATHLQKLVTDRKSTRLKVQSPEAISYAVFCLKKKTILNDKQGIDIYHVGLKL